ncbi:hypothetical protein [Aquimarina sp. AU58]|uniref:hypothetical protein n=1 Tax=Aquimarina sp. AU58 TaxID=1874112 RepID=UPI000D64D31D|nr:hypothetical protein [Aquimarina sp. AU58]
MKNNLSIFKEWKENYLLLIPVLGSLLISILQTEYYDDLLIALIILIFPLGLWTFSRLSKFKIILRMFSVFVFLHLIFFPFIYLWLIQEDQNSIKFDSIVSKENKTESLRQLDQQFKPVKISEKLEILRIIITDENNENLNKLLFIPYNYGVLMLNDFLVYPYAEMRPRENVHYLILCDKSGKFLFKMPYLNGHNDNNTIDITFMDFFKNSITILNKELGTYKKKKEIIDEKDDFWNYRKILPYSLNINSNSNMKPITKLANIVYAIHNFFVFGLILSIILRLISSHVSLKSRKKHD